MTAPKVARFEKWQGLGNDFAVFHVGHAGHASLADHVEMSPALARRLCDRRFGIGGDGVLLVSEVNGRPRMIVYNADGSRPEMCGNGLRCVASFLAARGAIQGGQGEIVVATDAGDRACAIRALESDLFEVTVDMGIARPGDDLVVNLDGTEHRFLAVDVGNPHAITFAPHAQVEIDRIGPAVAVAPPGGTNVEFCEISEGQALITVTVWERGVGRTLACGTGACAVAAAACETGRARFGAPIRVALPGGELEITVAQGSRALQMRGPARRVFSGEVVLA